LAANATTQRENQFRMVLLQWSHAPVGWVRLNTDGSCKDGGHIDCGGIIRGSNGEWIGGFSEYIRVCSKVSI